MSEFAMQRNVDYVSYEGDDILMQKLVGLSIGETRSLLHKYFVRVLDLRIEGTGRPGLCPNLRAG
jgi:hypothetical protein